MPKNFRIWIQSALDEAVLPKPITDEVIHQMFIINSNLVCSSIRCIIGEELLCPSALVFFYPSQLISIFLSNVMDLIQSPELLQVLARKVILPHFLLDFKLEQAMQKYDLWNGMALVGGLFSHFQILQKHEYYNALEAMKQTIDSCNISDLRQALLSATRPMDNHVVERILSVGHAMIYIQTERNVPLQINELAIASQPQDQALWDSVVMISSNLDWLVKESVP